MPSIPFFSANMTSFPGQYPFGFVPTVPPMPYYPPQAYALPSQANVSLPLSPPKPAMDPRIYPRIAEWLDSLDQSARGTDGDNYAQYFIYFDKASYRRIHELTAFTEERLIALSNSDIPEGVATRLISYLKEDLKEIEKRR
jgi:hypothetical protein